MKDFVRKGIYVLTATFAIVALSPIAKYESEELCSEKAFQASSLFRVIPRRDFEIVLEKTESLFLPRLTYLLTMQGTPILRVQVLPLLCLKLGEQSASRK